MANKERYMALADFQTLWTNMLKPAVAPADAALYPVKISSVTPTSTFKKGAIMGVDGIIYHATQDTNNLPCTLLVQDGAFVVHTVNGKTSFVVTDPTPNSGWEAWTDAAVEYWINSLDTRITALEGLTITYGGHTYTMTALLTEMAKLMDKNIVIG